MLIPAGLAVGVAGYDTVRRVGRHRDDQELEESAAVLGPVVAGVVVAIVGYATASPAVAVDVTVSKWVLAEWAITQGTHALLVTGAAVAAVEAVGVDQGWFEREWLLFGGGPA